MEFDFYKYKNILEAQGLKEAIRYKNATIPGSLYKFISLDNNINLNEQKFDTLKNNQIWLSSFLKLNDPFEGRAFFLNEKRLIDSSWPTHAIKLTKLTISTLKILYYIGCFVDKPSLPMWAYYANNHQWFCIEYKINKADYLYKVSYEKQRSEIATLVSYYVNSLKKNIEISPEAPNSEFQKWNEILKLLFVMKHKAWEHEGEYRLIFPIDDEKEGVSIDNKKLKIRPVRIFAGMECRPENLDILKNIADGMGCEIFHMIVNENALEFGLESSKIL